MAKQYGLRWRYVSEAYFVKDRHEKDNANCHLILAAKTRKGIGDLNFALSEANISGYYYRPRVDLELLMALDPRNVFVTTACVGGVFKYGWEDAEKLILRMATHFRDSFMLEVQYHATDKQREVNCFLLGLYRKHGIPLIMGTDSHYIYPEDAALRDQRLEANHIKYEDESGWYMDYPSGAEAYRRFKAQGVLSDAQIREAMENTGIFLTFEDVEQEAERVADDLIARGTDGVITASNVPGVAIVKALFKRGIHIQRDIKFVGFDYSNIYGLFEPAIPYMLQPLHEISIQSAEYLFRLIALQDKGEDISKIHDRIILKATLQ